MTDAAGMKLRVSTDALAGPYLRIARAQLDQVRQLLDGRAIPYSVNEHFISLNNGPLMGIIHFDRNADADAIQALLDSAA